ncbi:F-box/WD repeat-containing protein 9 isoform X2 [Lasioglossum baleicum]|uniref:F-box/WD repeat-containing protein 9 isoform X2 n=1 Tax=Lasioglossum baleicum TaxID=434251 RepID=UPI003FCD8CCC
METEDDELFWKLSCIALEKSISLWTEEGSMKDSMERLSLSHIHGSTIDGLQLVHNGSICISGARDRSLVCWKLPNEDNEKENVTCINFAHDGWIWDITSIDNMIYSCSWDQSVKAWTLTDTGLVHFKTYEMVVAGALLSVASCPELTLFATGSFFKTVLVYDTRSGSTPMITYEPHRGAVMKLVMNSEFIVSASEDKTVSVWDLRTRKVINHFTITQSFPMCICMQKDVIYVGDNTAKLYVLDPKKNFKVVKSYPTEHTKALTGVHVSPGCLITSSTDKTVRISTPTNPPRHLATLESNYGGITRSDYLNDVLAISGSEGIEIWRPKSRSNAFFQRVNESDNDRGFVGSNCSDSDPV